MEEGSSDSVDKLHTEYSQVWPKLQLIVEFLSLNLSELYNKISLCNTSDSFAAKNSLKRQIA